MTDESAELTRATGIKVPVSELGVIRSWEEVRV
jgi:hypothetical protein